MTADSEERAGASSAAKRQRFMESRERGWSVSAAAREVGVSRSAGLNWSRGYKTYRNGGVVGFVPPLDRLAVREISSRYLSQDERIEIADLRQSGLSMRAIALRPGRSTSTISRELRRNARAGRGYRPFDAHRRATARRARQHRRRVDTNQELGGLVAELLDQRWSPQQMHLPGNDADTLHAAPVARMQNLPPALMRSITWDQGTEMARHLVTTAKLGAPVYFCDSRSPWQRGSNEDTNGLLRDYFPKGVSVAGHSPAHLLAVETELNNRPRMVLKDRYPADLFAALLASYSPSVLRR